MRDERRRLRRVPYDEKVALWQRGPEGKALCWPAWGLNLSSGGIRLIVNRNLAQGEQVGIQLQPEKRALPGRVAWVKTHPDGCIVGICFTNVESSPPA
jgi:Tfp pilus assembly protein PilZ